MPAKKKSGSSTTRKTSVKKAEVKIVPVQQTQTRRVVNRAVKSSVTKQAMSSSNLWGYYGINAGNDQEQVDFARETGRRGAEIYGLNSGPATSQLINIPNARKRSRHAVLTNPYAKRAVDVLVSNVVGDGHKMRSQAPNKEFRKKVQDLWNLSQAEFDIEGKLSFAAQEAMVYRSMCEGGDCFVRFRNRRPSDGLHVPLQIQIFESEQVPIQKVEQVGTRSIVAGIEFDELGKPTAYHMYQSHPGEFIPGHNIAMTLQTVPVPAREVLHIHDMRRPNEVRGWPLIANTLIILNDLSRYLDAELVRKKAAALIGGFITEPLDDQSGNPFVINGMNSSDDSEIHIEQMEPGSFPILPPGYDVSFTAPVDVGQSFAEFLRQQLHLVCASLNITFEQLTGDMRGVNDRTMRASILEFKRIARMYQKNVMVHQFCQPVFDRWFDTAILSGALSIPSGMTYEDAKKVRWISDPWEFQNPQQEVNARVTEVRAGFVPRSEIIIENGSDPEEVDEQFRIDQQREKDNDLVFTTNTGTVSNAGVAHASDPSKTLEQDAIGDEEEQDDQEKQGDQNNVAPTRP